MSKVNQNKGKLSISIKRIREVFFSLDETLFNPNLSDIQFTLHENMGLNVEMGLIKFKLSVNYIYPQDPTQSIARIVTENVFEVNDLNNFLTSENEAITDEIKLPTALLTTILGLSISHTRALLAKNLAGTILNNTFLPIMDPHDIAEKMFGDGTLQKAAE